MSARLPYLNISLADEDVRLYADRAMWWPQEEILFISDPHFGKASTFRLTGIPVPECVHAADLQRLSRLLTHTKAKHLIILGDFMHSAKGYNSSTIDAINHWRSNWNALSITVIKGNHDRKAKLDTAIQDIQYLDGPIPIGPFALCHEPQSFSGAFVLCGHLHPAIRIMSKSARCFFQLNDQLVFPAFGEFTGNSYLNAKDAEKIYIADQGEIVLLPSVSSRA